MRSFKDFSINTKLVLLVTVAGGVALLLACAAFVVHDYRIIRASKVRQLSALADVLGSNSTAALTFDDPVTGTEILSSLRMQPTIEFACLYNAQGRVFAKYGDADQAPSRPGPPGYKFTDRGHLSVVQSIVQDRDRVGTIILRANMVDLDQQMLQYVMIMAVVMTVSMGGSILLSSRLQRAISLPILRLADAAQKISADADYSIRVSKVANDELGALYDEFNGMLDRIEQGEKELQKAHNELELRVDQRTRQLSQANRELSREVNERIRAENELEDTHQRLVEAARRAGMAEVATGVLHNVGNVLNSVNVSATLASDRLRNSKLSNLARTVDLINQNAGKLGDFFTRDERGKLLPEFLTMLAEHLEQERGVVLEELYALAKNVDHIKNIVAMQQSYAGVAGVVEAVSLAELVDDALKLNGASFEKHGIEIRRQYAELPEVRVEKQKLLQILVNLIANAKDALTESADSRRQVTVRIGRHDDDVRIEVSDNGVGIDADNLTRIFSHGFTTKRHGHGFGLHASANAAGEIGGRLTCTSEGNGHGAAFAIEFPYLPVELAV
ncbi:MAG: HAMP domain-containing protein [Pirellulales bacterium]|nr:HAMP domain-containing protein [Pirellulales bacterium]